MKIIRHGQLPEAKPIRAICRHCITEVEFTAGEAKRISDQRDGDFYQVTCPVCNNTITAAVPHSYNGPG